MTWAAVVVATLLGGYGDAGRLRDGYGGRPDFGARAERVAPHERASAAPHERENVAPQERLETITAIQIQGNTLTSDDDVRRLAGVGVGMPLEASTLDQVAARLKATGQFKQIEVRKRFASIEDPSQIVLVIVVDEGAVRIESTGDPDDPVRVVKDRHPNIMFLPVLSSEDGYGLTYGARFALPHPMGANSRVAFPLTWGGTKQAAVEIDKTFTSAPVNRLVGGVSISRRTKPFFEQDDDRIRAWVRAEREIVHALRVGATAGMQRVSFAGERDRFAHAGADVVVDTRLDPVLPRNAIYARAAWEHVALDRGIERVELEARGFVGLFGQNVLALRALRNDASQPLPPYLQPLLGGMANLRGFKAGFDAGDTLVATSAEVIVPLTSPLHAGKIGVSAFTDWGTVYDKGERLRDQTLRQGYGGGVWFTAAFARLNVAVAHGRGSSTRVHAGLDVSF
jgi:outer membrane protein assembly factor BamA